MLIHPETALNTWISQEVLERSIEIAAGLLIILVSYFISVIVKRIVMRLGTRANNTSGIYEILASSAKTAVLLFGAVVGLGTMGVDVRALVAGLGLTGFALGFAMKDLLSNAVSGILILIYRPIKLQQEINVVGQSGKVVNIDLRYTTIRNEEGHVLIPNSKIFQEVIKTH